MSTKKATKKPAAAPAVDASNVYAAVDFKLSQAMGIVSMASSLIENCSASNYVSDDVALALFHAGEMLKELRDKELAALGQAANVAAQ